MFKNVLVGADQSSTALLAVRSAVELASVYGATLHIVTAYKAESARLTQLPAEFDYASHIHPADALLT